VEALSFDRHATLPVSRRLRGGVLPEVEETVERSDGAPRQGEVDINAAVEEFSAALEGFMTKFGELQAQVSTTAKANFFGQTEKPEKIAERPDRVAFKQAFEHFTALQEFINKERSSSERLQFVASSMQLLRQAALLLAEEEDKIATAGVPQKTLDLLQSLRAQCRKKPKGTVAMAMDELKEALLPPIDAHKRLVAGIGIKRPEPVKAALAKEQIIEKLNAIPTFCLLNGEGYAVTVRGEDGSPTCSWFVDPNEASAVLTAAIRDNPNIKGLHLGVTPLGIAYGMCGGWGDDPPAGLNATLKLQGNRAVVKSMDSFLAKQLMEQGLPEAKWHLPVFCCDELQSASAMPMFLSRNDLVEAWELSGRPKEELPEALTVLDLHLLVHQMQTDKFTWNTVDLLCSRRAVELVAEAKQQAKALAAGKQGGGTD